ncbi:hypothetical protein OCD65_24980 [Bacillus paranthracis]|uniref:hypothetical protein n=1 Tax=Bacillus paranthracis TaxID=2026186 RepID=UPI0021CE6929|nr:hypothetical protein [Bacillus paranthracis]MCU5019944.1 hypothetical protein [Bacillus paranthracis]
MGEIKANVLSRTVKTLDIPVNFGTLTIVTGTAVKEEIARADTPVTITFQLSMSNINQVIKPPIGTANFLTQFPIGCDVTNPDSNLCNWIPKSFSAQWDRRTKSVLCSIEIQREGEQSVPGGQESSIPFQLYIYHR